MGLDVLHQMIIACQIFVDSDTYAYMNSVELTFFPRHVIQSNSDFRFEDFSSTLI